MISYKKGFTLIEMLVVVVIIGILAAALIPRLQGAQARARDVTRKSDLSQIRNALELYYVDNGSYPAISAGWASSYPASTNRLSMLANYLTKTPVDPVNSSDTPRVDNLYGYDYGYGPAGDFGPKNYLLITQLENKKDIDREEIKHSKIRRSNYGAGYWWDRTAYSKYIYEASIKATQ